MVQISSHIAPAVQVELDKNSQIVRDLLDSLNVRIMLRDELPSFELDDFHRRSAGLLFRCEGEWFISFDAVSDVQFLNHEIGHLLSGFLGLRTRYEPLDPALSELFEDFRFHAQFCETNALEICFDLEEFFAEFYMLWCRNDEIIEDLFEFPEDLDACFSEIISFLEK